MNFVDSFTLSADFELVAAAVTDLTPRMEPECAWRVPTLLLDPRFHIQEPATTLPYPRLTHNMRSPEWQACVE